jgi:hypothetical protein
MSGPLEAIYFDWLYAKVMLSDSPAESYFRLLQTLYETEFIWLVIGDDNRAEDGVALRYEFVQNLNFEVRPQELSFGCSVLEMMIALSRRAEFQTDLRPSVWFWEFVRNLGLSDYYDDNFDIEKVKDILHTFVWRSYNHDGSGGMFPLVGAECNQKEIEIWYQFSAYLIEKHFF